MEVKSVLAFWCLTMTLFWKDGGGGHQLIYCCKYLTVLSLYFLVSSWAWVIEEATVLTIHMCSAPQLRVHLLKHVFLLVDAATKLCYWHYFRILFFNIESTPGQLFEGFFLFKPPLNYNSWPLWRFLVFFYIDFSFRIWKNYCELLD